MSRIAWADRESETGAPKSKLNDHDFWRRLGLTVVETDLHNSGSHQERGGIRFVFVRRGEHRFRRRFTAAHEMGHLLLSELHREQDLISAQDEEKLCDEFASELLIPQAILERHLRETSGILALTPRNIVLLCRYFHVNVQPMLIALAQSNRFPSSVALLARRRGHPRRPAVVDYRVDTCPFREPFFVPPNQRLRSLGLGAIVEWAVPQKPGATASGYIENLCLRLWKRGQGCGLGVGAAPWQAQTLAEHALLLALDLSELDLQWQRPKSK